MPAEKLPPHDIDAEEAVLGSALVDADAIVKMAPIVKSGDFFREKNAWIWEAMLTIWERKEAVNQITVAHELARSNRLEEIGGVSYLSALITQLPTPLGCEHYAAIVRRCSVCRHLIDVSGRITALAWSNPPDGEAMLSQAYGMVGDMLHSTDSYRFISIADVLSSVYMEGTPAASGLIHSGFPSLEGIAGAFRKGELVIIGARTGMGKTSLLLQLVRNAAVGQGKRVAIFSLEMSSAGLVERLLSQAARVSGDRIALGQHSELEEARIMRTVGEFAQSHIYIAQDASLGIGELQLASKALALRDGLDMIVVDYLQLVGPHKRCDTREQEVSSVSRGLKALARDLNLPVVAAAQLSRKADERQTRPRLSDLRESGALEQDAGLVIFLHGEHKPVQHPIEVIIAKNRYGREGSVTLDFLPQYTRFEDRLGQEE